MITISKCISVFLIGILELWVAVPAGLAFKLHFVLVILSSATGAATGAFFVLAVGEPLRKWLMSLKKVNIDSQDGKFRRIWDTFGIPGLCLISPLLLGAHIGAAIALSLNGKKAAIAIWMTISCFLWATIFTIFGSMGVSLFHK